jgi:GntR family transcriptional regulator
MIKSSKFETRPLYLQVRDMLLGRITTGNWKPGTLIPNEVDLAREFGLSVGTVRKALDQLQAERLLTRRQGRGTFVNDLSSAEHSSRFSNLYSDRGERIAMSAKTLSASVAPASEAQLRALELSKNSSVINLVRLRSSPGGVRMYEECALPAALFRGLVDDGDIPDEIAAIAQRYGQIVGSAEESVSVTAANEDAAAKLSVAVGSPLMVLDRRAFAVDGIPVEWRQAICHAPATQYRCKVA